MRKTLVIGVVVVFIVAAGVFFYKQHTGTPKYSLWQAKKAFESHDRAAFEKYVDIEGVCSSLIDQTLAIAMEETETENEWESLGRSLGLGLISLMKPRLVEILEEQVSGFVETGSMELYEDSDEPEETRVGLSQIYDNADAEKSTFRGITNIKKEGKIAYVGLEFLHEKYDTSLILSLKMRDMGGYWQVAEISNYGSYVKQIDALEEKRIADLNRPIIEEMSKTLVLVKLKKYTTSGRWGYDKNAVFTLQFRNESGKEIDEFGANIVCRKDGDLVKRLSVVDSDNIAPQKTGGGSWSHDVNMFVSSDNVLYDTPQSELAIDVQLQYIKFEDGSELKLYQKGDDI